MDNQNRSTTKLSIIAGLLFVFAIGCQEVDKEALQRCYDTAGEEIFNAKQSYDSCYLEASNRMIAIMDNCDQIAPVNSTEHSQCLREAIAQFRVDVADCAEAYNARTDQAVNDLIECINQVTNSGN